MILPTLLELVYISATLAILFAQTALAVGVLTSNIGVRVRMFFPLAWKLAGNHEYVCNVPLSKMSTFWLKCVWPLTIVAGIWSI